MQGIVFDIKRFAVHDGPGIRTTVHMKGCPLKCVWCHNPEGISPKQLVYKKKVRLGEMEFDQEEVVGTYYSVTELVDELVKDQLFWEESNGGVTFSGGEPFMQFPFLLEAVKVLKQKKIHVAIDTCGIIEQQKLAEIAHYADLFLFDLKVVDSALHREFTGVGNELILSNLKWLSENKINLQVRIPVIPTKNYNREELQNFLDFIEGLSVKSIDLLPFHAIANAKYDRFQINNEMKAIDSLSKEDLMEWKYAFVDNGFEVNIGG